MRHDPAYRAITADEFLEIDFGTDKKFELHDGVIYMMTGGTHEHSWVQGNIFSWLKIRLRGSGCRPHGSDMAVKVSETDVRYPDVAIYCNQPSVEDLMGSKVLDNPTVIIEVLSQSTSTVDQGTKLDEYQALASVQTIAFVDPVNELCRTRERLVQGGWHDQMFSGERGIPIPTLGFTIPHEEIFARD
ncbi:Uma2 family endonuclease [Sphingomonas gei]|uniref:Uma2 family endonuclease n=1 Tax=Sphingomonas gei TaxID=1395960 RepID=A0A4S1XHU2_9SPHN|nr:Uma2 family endonuclease [Sphingomonas gei]TGX55625.1 Uma2 family endonuclease [Sphingomonas gei]